jgi:glycosyltransferase involved in cell wall biosynthesis
MKKLYYASGLNKGGGLTILNIFFKELDSKNFFFIDERTKIKKKNNIFIVKNNLLSKILSEIRIKKIIKPYTKIIFLNGLPPFKRYNNQVSVYFQNANIIPIKFMHFFDINFIFSKNFLRFIKFILFKKNSDNWYVFSKFSKKILSKYIPRNKIFIKKININCKKKQMFNKYDLIYPASGENHKNHHRLFNALIILSKKEIFPKLVITLNKYELNKLNVKYIKKKYSLKIYNKYSNNRIKFLNMYNQCKALIYPSLSETLGLPLLEAKKFNIDIITSNKDFAKEYSNPKLIFNPYSSISIANKIEQYISKKITN